ncbi:hypothetical protein E2562_013580 [Oryza meyeriana var. granulata]|uniref:BED-type domain-containing protein n=1 Tax=Oryza meyeriana var. granulata TaxID=110450 RepID=A0A6G1C5N1_9ORYZ|nr:hypothetical protein E2562_013580 [Oryza meyeriana var. granulata]
MDSLSTLESEPLAMPVEQLQSREDSYTAEAEQGSRSQQKNRGKSDPAWDHCVEIVPKDKSKTGKPKLRCFYCQEVFQGGGIHQFKRHLAGVKGDVKSCPKVDAEVRYEMQQNIEAFACKKRKSQEAFEENNPYGLDKNNDDQSEDNVCMPPPSTHSSTKGKTIQTLVTSTKDKPKIGKIYMPRTNPRDQPSLKNVLQSQKLKDKVDLLVNKWFIDASIPFNGTNSKYYQPMIDAIPSYGPGYKGSTSYEHRGPLLVRNAEETKNFVQGYRKIWKETGCTIMADGWTDTKKRTLINFLVYCPRGMVFLKSVDATDSSKTGVIDVIERYAAKDPTLRSALTKEMRIFRNAEGDFGRITTVSDRAVTLPDEWWIAYGCSASNLQKLAVRVLGQTCSAFDCERNWSLFEHIHSKKRNRLEHQRMCDIVYVHCNQRLQQRFKFYAQNYDPISLEYIGKFNENRIIEKNPLGLNAEEIDTFRKELAENTPDCNYNGIPKMEMHQLELEAS